MDAAVIGRQSLSSHTTSMLLVPLPPAVPYILVRLSQTIARRRRKLTVIVNKVRTEFRQIFFEMGFTEMPTNRCAFTIP